MTTERTASSGTEHFLLVKSHWQMKIKEFEKARLGDIAINFGEEVKEESRASKKVK